MENLVLGLIALVIVLVIICVYFAFRSPVMPVPAPAPGNMGGPLNAPAPVGPSVPLNGVGSDGIAAPPVLTGFAPPVALGFAPPPPSNAPTNSSIIADLAAATPSSSYVPAVGDKVIYKFQTTASPFCASPAYIGSMVANGEVTATSPNVTVRWDSLLNITPPPDDTVTQCSWARANYKNSPAWLLRYFGTDSSDPAYTTGLRVVFSPSESGRLLIKQNAVQAAERFSDAVVNNWSSIMQGYFKKRSENLFGSLSDLKFKIF